MPPAILSTAFLLGTATLSLAAPVRTVPELSAAVKTAKPGTTIELAAATFRLTQPLDLPAGLTLTGAGIGKTIITHADSWRANHATLPDPETNHEKFDRSGYLLRCLNDAGNISISQLTLTGPALHGAVFGMANHDLHLHHLHIENFLFSGIRTYAMKKAKIHDCTFLNAGQRWEDGKPGIKGGITGGGIFSIWLEDSEIFNNRFLVSGKAPNEHYYGIKGREAKRCRIHHNTIEAGFSIEFPFDNDQDVEIDHNILHAAISIPKYAGGPVPQSGRTFHIHHNWFRDSYSIEFVRNGVEIDHNLFDFDTKHDGGNLISAFGDKAAPGPCLFHNNLVSNPGRGVIWMNEPYAHLTVRNNHIIARPTADNRDDGLFGFNEASDFSTFRFENNIIECRDKPRPLFRNDASGKSSLTNNRLTGITDTARYQNPPTKQSSGLEAPLKFTCGVSDEMSIDGWVATLKKKPKP
jgi:hypothetical protein